jgi:hypothetical protein
MRFHLLWLLRSRGRRGLSLVAVTAFLVVPGAAGGTADTPLTITALVYGTAGANGWYTSNVTVNWRIDGPIKSSQGCEAVTLTTDTPGTTLTCRATSLDGKTTVQVSKTIKLDKTAPTLSRVTVKQGNRIVRLHWRASADTRFVEVARSPGARGARTSVFYRGTAHGYRDKGLKVGRAYRYTVTGFDQAANRSAKTLTLRAAGALFAPGPGASVTSPPLLVWTPVKGASYYNVQLMRGQKVFSAWPTGPRLRLPRAWTYEGRRYRLHRGVYRWYVWPGFGAVSAGRYGHMLGGSSFLFTG